jgi:hypothetical protein
MKNVVFWDVALVNRRFGGTYRLHLQPPAHAGSPLADFSTLKMEAIRSSETLVNARSTQRHIPEGDILQRERSLGTPIRKWEDNIKMDLRETALGYGLHSSN